MKIAWFGDTTPLLRRLQSEATVEQWKDGQPIGPAIEQAESSDFAIFAQRGLGKTCQRLRRNSCAVLGGSRFIDDVTSDFRFAKLVLERIGVAVPDLRLLKLPEEADQFFRDVPPPVVVQYMKGESACLHDSQDVRDFAAFLHGQRSDNRIWPIIAEKIGQGIIVGIEGWFDGQRWILPFALRFDYGFGGEVVWFCQLNRLIETVLLPMTSLLAGRYLGPFEVVCSIDQNVSAIGLSVGLYHRSIEIWLESVEGSFADLLDRLVKRRLSRLPIADDRIAMTLVVARHWEPGDVFTIDREYAIGSDIEAVRDTLLRLVRGHGGLYNPSVGADFNRHVEALSVWLQPSDFSRYPATISA